MAIYFASNRLGQFSALSSATTEVLTAGTFNASFVGSSISIPASAASLPNFISALVNIDASLVTSINTRHDLWISGNAANPAAGSGFIMQWVNNVGQVVADISNAAGSTIAYQFRYWNGAAFIASGPTFTPTQSVLLTFATRLTCGAAGSVDIYIGNALVASVPSSSGLNAAVNNVAAVRFCNPAVGAASFVSQVGLTDQDMRSWNFTSDSALGSGTFNDGTGAFSDTNSFPRDQTKARVLPANGNKFSMTKTARSIPGNLVIQNVIVNAAARATGGVVANMRNGVAIAGVWYPMPNANPAPNGGYENRGGYFSTSPLGTGLPVTSAEFNAMQFGTEART